MIPWYAMPSIITRSPARRAHPRTKARWRHPVSARERVLRALIGGAFRFGNLESFWGTHPGSPRGGGPGSTGGRLAPGNVLDFGKLAALEQHEADYYVVRITLFSSWICRTRNLTSCGHLRCVYWNLSREIWSRIGSEVSSGDFLDRNLEV